jgi:hypothetical protein
MSSLDYRILSDTNSFNEGKRKLANEGENELEILFDNRLLNEIISYFF